MKTKNDFKKLNYTEYAFFKGASTTDAKFVFARLLFPNDWQDLILDPVKNKRVYNSKYSTDKGSPKIKSTDMVSIKELDFTMNSNSGLDGSCQMAYLCDFYNRGIPLNKLREHSQNETFKKALKFTGKNSVINEIINTEQLLKLQKTWLLSNTYMKNNWTKNCIEFIENNDWSLGFLEVNMIYKSEFITQKNKLNPEQKAA